MIKGLIMTYRNFNLLLITLACLIGIPLTAQADTCPTQIKQDTQGYWYSEQKPGWRSHVYTSTDIKLDTHYFGGVVFSPKQQRMACVYKATNGRWLAIVSDSYDGFKIDKQAVDESGAKAAWQYSDQHSDFSCGRPSVTKLTGCPFNTD